MSKGPSDPTAVQVPQPVLTVDAAATVPVVSVAPHTTRTATTAARGDISNAVAGPKRGKGQSGEKGRQARLRIGVADDPNNLTDAIIRTVELDCKESSVAVSFSAKPDPGSQCTAITHAIFNRSFPHNILHQPTQSLINFDGSPVNSVQGYFTTKVHFEGCSCSARVYVLDNTCAPVIGWDLMTHLSMHLDCSTGQMQCTKEGKGPEGDEQGSKGLSGRGMS